MGALVLQGRESKSVGEQPRERGAAKARQSGVKRRAHRAVQAPETLITEITDDDYRSAWRPCEALDEEPPPQ